MLQRVRGAGFTLVEILLVISLIAILAVIVLTGLNLASSKARDAKRITDLKTIASALEFYYDDTGHYPIAIGQVTTCGQAGASWIPDGSNFSWGNKYISKMPRDPAENCSGSNQHTYTYQSDGSTYDLTTTLENPSPPSTTNQTFAYNGSSFQPVFDTAPIGVSFSSPVSSPTNQSPIPLVITFSRDVIDFAQNSLSLSCTA